MVETRKSGGDTLEYHTVLIFFFFFSFFSFDFVFLVWTLNSYPFVFSINYFFWCNLDDTVLQQLLDCDQGHSVEIGEPT
jgi:hypothetical protein